MRLLNKSIIVTGAGSGIGEGIALRLAQEGAQVVVNDIDSSQGQRVVSSIVRAGGQASFFAADVTQSAQVKALVAHAGRRCDVDEAAAALRAKHRHGVQGREVNAFDIDGVAAVKVGFADLERGLVAVRPAGIVDHHIQPAVLPHGVCHQCFHLLALCHIGRKK